MENQVRGEEDMGRKEGGQTEREREVGCRKTIDRLNV
jgi:hypothetical protein